MTVHDVRISMAFNQLICLGCGWSHPLDGYSVPAFAARLAQRHDNEASERDEERHHDTLDALSYSLIRLTENDPR